MYRLHDIWGASQVHMKRHYHHYTISCKYSGLRCQKGLRNTSQVVRRRRPNLKPSLKKLQKLKQRVRWYFAFNRFAFLTFSVQLHLLNLVNFTLYCTVRLLCSFFSRSATREWWCYCDMCLYILQVHQVPNQEIRQKKLLQNPAGLPREAQTRSLNFRLT